MKFSGRSQLQQYVSLHTLDYKYIYYHIVHRLCEIYFSAVMYMINKSVHFLVIVSSNPTHGQVYSIQHYVMKFVSDLRQFGGFLLSPSNNKADRHDITEISLNVALNTITLSPTTK